MDLGLGKIPPALLARLLEAVPRRDEGVLVGPAVGEDAAVLRPSPDKLLVAKSDPITFTTQETAWYAVHVNANDIACMGADPRWFLATILLPEGSDDALVERVFAELKAALRDVGAELVGGHTELTPGVRWPIISGTMLGETTPDQLVDNTRIELDDDLILIKGIAIEATSIIVRERAEELKQAFSESWIQNARDFLRRPGISVLEPARRVREICRPHALHDPTEGGLAGAVRELGTLAGLGVHLFGDHIHIYPETDTLAAEFGLDPLGLIASGALLVACDPDDTDVILDQIRDHDTEAFVIGKFIEAERGFLLEEEGEVLDLPVFESDEITKLF